MIPKYSNIMPQAVVAKTFGAIVAGDKTYLLHQACYQGQSKDKVYHNKNLILYFQKNVIQSLVTLREMFFTLA